MIACRPLFLFQGYEVDTLFEAGFNSESTLSKFVDEEIYEQS